LDLWFKRDFIIYRSQRKISVEKKKTFLISDIFKHDENSVVEISDFVNQDHLYWVLLSNGSTPPIFTHNIPSIHKI
jgi:hypothetical protein